MTGGEKVLTVAVVGLGAYAYLKYRQSQSSSAPRPTPAPIGAPPSIGTAIGAAYASVLPGAIRKPATVIAGAEGNALEGGLKRTLRGDKEIITGHPIQGLKDVGAGYYHAATDVVVAGGKKVLHFIGL